MEEKQKWNIFLSLPFFWIVLTILYTASDLLLRPAVDFGKTIIPATIGFFVPIGLGGLVFAPKNGITILANFLVLAVIFGGEFLFSKINLNPAIKIVWNLVVLFALTVVADYMIWGHWVSMALFNDAFKHINTGSGIRNF